MYNKMFSILTREKGTLRGVSKGVYIENPDLKAIHNALVPNKDNTPFIDLAAEQLIQCVISSNMSKSMESFDPESLYRYPLEFPIVFEYHLSDIADNINVSYKEADTYNTVLEGSCLVEINRNGNKITFKKGDRVGDVEYFTYDDNLSSPIVINKNITININNLSSGIYETELNYKLPYNRNLLDILNDLPPSVHSRYEYASRSQLPDYIASIVMDTCMGQEIIK